MYVRKFEADSLDEALKNIKAELGPDAIILKTVTNKGLKGAFKKSKIEITAAISEKSYTKKAKVDHVLAGEQKEKFYNNSSSYISNMIDNYSQKNESSSTSRTQVGQSGYGEVGLNRQVKTVKNIGSKIMDSLDDFLSSGVGEVTHNEVEKSPFSDDDLREEIEVIVPKTASAPIVQTQERPNINDEVVEAQKLKIEELERKLFELTRNVQRLDKKEPNGVYHLRTTLRSLNINDQYIQEITRKAIFDLSDAEVENSEIVFEFALNEMLKTVQVGMPLFSTVDEEETPVVTVLLSETSTGQTSMLYKLGALKKDTVLIQRKSNGSQNDFTEKFFGLKTIVVESIPEIISEIRKATEAGRSVLVDYKEPSGEINETKKFVDGLKRSFSKVEILISLCAIHSEIYNRKVLSRYGKISNGVVVSSLDLCLNYGSLFNLSYEFNNLPLKFFGTGEVVPDDLEAASAERVLAGIFQFE